MKMRRNFLPFLAAELLVCIMLAGTGFVSYAAEVPEPSSSQEESVPESPGEPDPTPTPTAKPTAAPTPDPTKEPEPTPDPTAEPTSEPESESPSSLSETPTPSPLPTPTPSAGISLPDVSGLMSSESSAVISVNDRSKTNLIGILCWVLIGAGIVTVLLVLFRSNRHNGRMGKKRYRVTGRRRKKRLLSDKYYNRYK